MDMDTSSYLITTDTQRAICDECRKVYTDSQFPKTARLFN